MGLGPNDAQGVFSRDDVIYYYMKDIVKNHEKLTSTEQIELIKKYQNTGDLKARDRVVNSTLKWVYYIAFQYKTKFSQIELEDLISQGSLGILKAIDKFDSDIGTTFLTYANSWISHHIKNFISRNLSPVKIPLHLTEIMTRIGKKMQNLSYIEGETERQKVERIADDLRQTKNVSREYINKVLQSGNPYYVLEGKYIDDDEMLSNEFNENGYIDPISNLELRQFLLETIDKCLTEKESRIIILRYGLEYGYAMTLKKTGEIVGLSNERVRQIQEVALNKLRDVISSSKLDSFR